MINLFSLENDIKSVIYNNKLSNLLRYILSVFAGILFGTVILFNLPLKWSITIVLAEVFVTVLITAPKTERVLLFVLTLIIPFSIGTGLPAIFTDLYHIGPWKSLDVQAIDILIVILLLYRLARFAVYQTNIRFYPSTSIPALAWLLANALSIINSKQIDISVLQVGNMFKLWLLYIIVANSIENETDVKWVMRALILGVLFQGALGIYQWVAGSPLGISFLGEPTQLYYGRSMGTIGNPNGYGLYLAATMPIGIALLFTDISRLYKALASLALFAAILGLVFSLSRGGWLGFLVALIVVLVFAIRRNRQNLKRALVGVGILLLFLLSLNINFQDLIIVRLTSQQGQESAFDRITLAQGAIAMIQDEPILGVGANNYSLLMPEYDPYDFAFQHRIVIVHNIYLLVASETGLIGLAAFLWFLAILIIQAKRLATNAPSDVIWLAGVGSLSAFAALTVQGMGDYDLLGNATVFRLLWLFAAIIASLSERADTFKI